MGRFSPRTRLRLLGAAVALVTCAALWLAFVRGEPRELAACRDLLRTPEHVHVAMHPNADHGRGICAQRYPQFARGRSYATTPTAGDEPFIVGDGDIRRRGYDYRLPRR